MSKDMRILKPFFAAFLLLAQVAPVLGSTMWLGGDGHRHEQCQMPAQHLPGGRILSQSNSAQWCMKSPACVSSATAVSGHASLVIPSPAGWSIPPRLRDLIPGDAGAPPDPPPIA